MTTRDTYKHLHHGRKGKQTLNSFQQGLKEMRDTVAT